MVGKIEGLYSNNNDLISERLEGTLDFIDVKLLSHTNFSYNRSWIRFIERNNKVAKSVNLTSSVVQDLS